MRIVQICSARYIGGGERHVADLSNALAKKGHQIFGVLAPSSPLRTELKHIPDQNLLELQLRNSVDLVSAVKLAKFARDQNIDLIHAHIAKDYLIAAAASRIARVPYVITRHVLFPMSGVHRGLLSQVRSVIAVSNAIYESLRAQRIFPENKIVTIRYGVDPKRFPESERLPHQGLRVATVGNLDPVKGTDVFVRAAAIVAAQCPDVMFEIIGEDRDRTGRNKAEITRLISELKLNDRVVLTGWSDDIKSRMAATDVFVSTARSESFGAAITEAMLCRVPVVATATAGAKEIISNPSLGRLVPVDSPLEVANSILSLISDPTERHRLGHNSRAHVIDQFSLAKMVDDIEGLYRRAIA